MNAAVLKTLLSATRSLENARRPSSEGGLPKAPGFFAWWSEPDALPGVLGPSHPSEAYELLYIGIAPARPRSTGSLRTTVLTKQVSGNTAASPWRLSLAALLRETEGFQPLRRGAKVMLAAADNRRLSEWQEAHLRLTWYERDKPFTLEGDVIRVTKPPLNLAENEEHPLHEALMRARRGFLEAAG